MARGFATGVPVVGTVVLLLSLLAGCIGSDPGADPAPGPADAAQAPWAVVALVDTGINPYHEDFRLEGPLARVHPSEYLPGYPAEIPVVNLTLDAADIEAALEADAAVWSALESEQPYWFAGTRVTGISFGSTDDDVGAIWSTGHGTMVASKAAGKEYSLCPTCHVVGVQGFSGTAVAWTAEQAWIDVQSNSWGPSPAFAWADAASDEPDLNRKFWEAARHQAVLVAAGNGIGGAFGIVGNPSPTDSTSGPPGVIAVGGNDNGHVTAWSAWGIHVVADDCWNWAAVGDTIAEWSARAGGGTSAASPYTAGAVAAMILEARSVLGSTTARNVETGVFAAAAENATLPAEGPLADGDLTLAELKAVLFRTASPVPQADRASGDQCEPAGTHGTLPIAWESVPSGSHLWPWIGYGSVEEHSLQRGVAVLRGEEALPERSTEDELYAHDQSVREAYHSFP